MELSGEGKDRVPEQSNTRCDGDGECALERRRKGRETEKPRRQINLLIGELPTDYNCHK